MDWIIPANNNIYDHEAAFKKWGYIDWKQNSNYSIGDIVYIYCTRPLMKIMYKTQVEKVKRDFSDIVNDKEFWFDKSQYGKAESYVRLRLLNEIEDERLGLNYLLEHGLKGAPQRGVKINSDELKIYIEKIMQEGKNIEILLEEEGTYEIYEGGKSSIKINKYERSPNARQKCIEYHGVSCKICGMNFEEVYGEVGKGFIHVHHIKPISEIDKEYTVDYKNDLIPVCPNCHAMLHRKINGRNLSIDELKKVINRK